MVGKRLDPKNGGCSCLWWALGLVSPLGGTIASVFLFSFPKLDWCLWTSDKRHIVLLIGILPSPSSQAVITATSSQLRHAAKPQSQLGGLHFELWVVWKKSSTQRSQQNKKQNDNLSFFWQFCETPWTNVYFTMDSEMFQQGLVLVGRLCHYAPRAKSSTWQRVPKKVLWCNSATSESAFIDESISKHKRRSNQKGVK